MLIHMPICCIWTWNVPSVCGIQFSFNPCIVWTLYLSKNLSWIRGLLIWQRILNSVSCIKSTTETPLQILVDHGNTLTRICKHILEKKYIYLNLTMPFVEFSAFQVWSSLDLRYGIGNFRFTGDVKIRFLTLTFNLVTLNSTWIIYMCSL